MTGTNLPRAKRHNTRLVHEMIRLHAPISRADIARRTRLTSQTISNLVRELVESGYVTETVKPTGSRGAPPVELDLNPDAAFAVGIDLGSDHVTAVLVDLVGRVRARSASGGAPPSPAAAVEVCAEAVRSLSRDASISPDKVVGVGVGVPGPMRPGPNGAYLVSPLAFPAWKDFALARQLQERIDLPVHLENDATAAALGERWYGAGKEVSTFFYVYLGSGLGGGLIARGTPFEGHTGNAGEIGYLPPRRPRPGDPSHVGALFNVPAFCSRLRSGGTRASTLDDLSTLYESGHPEVDAWFGRMAEELGALLLNVRVLFDPELFFLGGRWPNVLLRGLAERISPLLDEAFDGVGLRDVPLRLATAGPDAGALGVATLPLYHAFAPVQRPAYHGSLVSGVGDGGVRVGAD